MGGGEAGIFLSEETETFHNIYVLHLVVLRGSERPTGKRVDSSGVLWDMDVDA